MSIHKHTLRGLATLLALAGALLLPSAQAGANLVNFSLTSSFGSFRTNSIAVDESSGDVYALSGSAIYKFDAYGNPVNFSALGSNVIEGLNVESRSDQIAVDNSSGPAKGDIYVATGSGVVIFGQGGESLGALEEGGHPWGEPCGVAVDPSGHVYLGLRPEHVNEYTPTANPVTSADYTASFGLDPRGEVSACEVAADAEGSVYVDSWAGLAGEGTGPIFKYDASQFGSAAAVGTRIVTEGRGSLAVDATSGELFVVREEVLQYDSSGSLLNTFGANTNKQLRGVAVNAKNGRLYVGAGEGINVWQGQIVPTTHTGEATGLDSSGLATLTGSVNPEETSVSSCVFEYGASASYGSSQACAQGLPLTGSSPVGVSAGLSGVLLNHVWHYRLAAANENGTSHGPDRTFAILVLPKVEDQAPEVSSIGPSSVLLSGTIDPEQGVTSYHVDYGPTAAYGLSTPVSHTGDGISGDTAVQQPLAELLPGTTYHYRLVARNLAGTTLGADHTFTTTAPTPPVVSTGSAGGISANTATVSGTIGTRGLPATYGFEIGTEAGVYGPPTGLGAVGAGAGEAPVSLTLTGLAPGTTYHYRITATNVDGVSYGSDQSFTTGTFANVFVTPPAPLPFVTVPSLLFPAESSNPVVKKSKKVKHKKAKPKAKHKRRKKK
jgi:hypothetical protein